MRVEHHVAERHLTTLDTGFFKGCPNSILVNSFHDFAIDELQRSAQLNPIAWAEDGTIEGVAHVEQTVGKTLGDAADPLLVSVRSGAAISMPGMMDTVLNLGLNDETVKGLSETFGEDTLKAVCDRVKR